MDIPIEQLPIDIPVKQSASRQSSRRKEIVISSDDESEYVNVIRSTKRGRKYKRVSYAEVDENEDSSERGKEEDCVLDVGVRNKSNDELLDVNGYIEHKGNKPTSGSSVKGSEQSSKDKKGVNTKANNHSQLQVTEQNTKAKVTKINKDLNTTQEKSKVKNRTYTSIKDIPGNDFQDNTDNAATSQTQIVVKNTSKGIENKRLTKAKSTEALGSETEKNLPKSEGGPRILSNAIKKSRSLPNVASEVNKEDSAEENLSEDSSYTAYATSQKNLKLNFLIKNVQKMLQSYNITTSHPEMMQSRSPKDDISNTRRKDDIVKEMQLQIFQQFLQFSQLIQEIDPSVVKHIVEGTQKIMNQFKELCKTLTKSKEDKSCIEKNVGKTTTLKRKKTSTEALDMNDSTEKPTEAIFNNKDTMHPKLQKLSTPGAATNTKRSEKARKTVVNKKVTKKPSRIQQKHSNIGEETAGSINLHLSQPPDIHEQPMFDDVEEKTAMIPDLNNIISFKSQGGLNTSSNSKKGTNNEKVREAIPDLRSILPFELQQTCRKPALKTKKTKKPNKQSDIKVDLNTGYPKPGEDITSSASPIPNIKDIMPARIQKLSSPAKYNKGKKSVVSKKGKITKRETHIGKPSTGTPDISDIPPFQLHGTSNGKIDKNQNNERNKENSDPVTPDNAEAGIIPIKVKKLVSPKAVAKNNTKNSAETSIQEQYSLDSHSSVGKTNKLRVTSNQTDDDYNMEEEVPDRTPDMIRKSVLNFQKDGRRSKRLSKKRFESVDVNNYDSDSSIEIVDVSTHDDDREVSAEVSRKRRLKKIRKNVNSENVKAKKMTARKTSSRKKKARKSMPSETSPS